MLLHANWLSHPTGAPKGPADRYGNPSPYFRKAFPARGAVRRATLTIAALGVYRLYLNGAPVSDEYLSPPWVDYARKIPLLAYDVTDRIAAENAVGVVLGDGWAVGHLGSTATFCRCSYADTAQFAAEILLEYADGTRETVARMVKFAGATCIWARWSITANRWGIFPPRLTTTAIGRPPRWMISNFPKISISPASTCRPSASSTPSPPRWSPPTARRASTTLARTSPGCCGWCCAARRARMPSCATPKCCGTANSTPKTSARPRPPTRSSCAAATPRNSARCSRRTASATRRSSCTAT